jgi:lipoprotein NlpD
MDARRSEVCSAALGAELTAQVGQAAMKVCRLRNWIVVAIVPALICGCAAPRPAPVLERQPEIRLPTPAAKTPAAAPALAPQPDSRPEFYTVKKGDTLYSIALEHGLDYRELAEWNNLGPVYAIRVGQQLRLRPPPATVVTAPLKAPPPVTGKPVGSPPPAQRAPGEMVKSQPKAVKMPYSEDAVAKLSVNPAPQPKPAGPTIGKVETQEKPVPQPEKPAAPEADDEKVSWAWPVSGKVLAGFNESGNLKGLDIAGKLGQAVCAAAPGKVIFSGDGPRGYGKLIVVKHNNAFISVYAHNNDLLVSYGQTVTKGQKIAEMGSTDADRVKLHFEIRRFGKPVDPMKLLPDNPA